jgi:Carboxypeptidase regulatory-like domain
MVSSTRLIVAAVLLIFSAAVSSSSQTTPEKAATASISGKVKIKDKAVAGVVVFAQEQNPRGWRSSNYRSTTDQSGNYRITNLPAGTYSIRPAAPSFALEDYVTNNAVVVVEGETVEDINFSMAPGGVITGKISDADGKPLINEYVTILPVDPGTFVGARFEGLLNTDDRGIYRAFGLRPGKYKVSVGQNESLPGDSSRSFYRQTFYPSVSDIAKATVIEVTEGSETANIDIIPGRPVTTFKVSGRILDAETESPLVHIRIGVFQGNAESGGGASRIGPNFTNANGEFRLENVLPGKYVVFIVPEDSGVRGDSVSFEVVDRDVTDLVVQAGKATTVTGVVVFEGGEESKSGFKINDLHINAWAEGGGQRFSGFSQLVKPDGTFKLADLRKGKVHFSFASPTRNDFRQLQLVRIERDGVIQPGGLILKDGEQVTGVRLVVKLLTGAIHGQIKVEGDDLPASRISVWLTYLDDARQGEQFSMGNSSPQLDSRKRFVVEGLAAGTYEVNVAVFDPGRQDTSKVIKQQVTVADNAVSDVTITIKSKP